MDSSSIKAFAATPEPSWLTLQWYHLKWWWTDSVWYRYAPDWVRRLARKINDFWYRQISCRVFPRQAWLTKAAGRTWCDKTELVVTILYATIIHFVEQEKCFEVTDWTGSGLAEQEKQLKEIYDWIKVGRPALQARIMAAYPPIDSNIDTLEWLSRADPVRDACYIEVSQLEKEMEEWDTRCLTWIVANRNVLWC
jgi:hypothetical protein